MSDPIVGIDLGTSNTVVAHASAAGNVTVLADDAGYKIHPSVVSFHPNGGVVVGAAAKQRKVIDPQNTVYSVKRLIGRAFASPEVQTAKGRVPFQIKEGPSSAPVIVTRGGTFAVPEISAIVLDHVRNVAAARLERPVERAVVTVPASFNDAQRSATATAGAIAGITVVRVLNEPTAAALAYGHSRNLREVIAVYDFGGGTFDISFLKLEDQVYEVLGTSGDTFLGGDDFDERLVEKMVAKFLTDNRIDLRSNEVSMMRLRAVAEQTKIELSRRSRAVVRVDEIAYGPRGAPLNLQIEITRDEFVRDIADLVDRTFPVCSEALALAGLTVDRVSDVILVGGSTKIPHVRDQVSKYFGKAPRTDINPEDAVAAGAALQATSLERILSRKPSSKHSIAARGPDEDTVAGGADVLQLADPESGATMAPSELTVGLADERNKRPTPSYGEMPRPPTSPTKPDTRYSVSRAGVRDEVAGAEHYPVAPQREAGAGSGQGVPPAAELGFDEGSPSTINQTRPLARMVRAAPAPPGAGQPAMARTVFGVPPAPTSPASPAAIDIELGSAGTTSDDGWTDETGEQTNDRGEARSDARVERPVTAQGAATPPPVPRPNLRQAAAAAAARPPPPPLQATAPLPAIRKTPEPRPAVQPPVSGWLDVPSGPAATQPMAPSAPIAPPTAPTMIATIPVPAPEPTPATTARGMGAVREPSPASTARGFQPPQSYPIHPAFDTPPPLPAAPPVSPRAAAAPTYVPPAPVAVAPMAVAMAPAPVLLEVTPRGLGIGTVAGFCEELIRRNSRVPTEIRKLFITSRDNQDLVRIVVCQGESRRLDNNTVIGDLVLQNLPRRPRGETSIEVAFALDASGVLHVRARDAQTGAEQRATLSLVGGVPEEEVAASQARLQQLRR